MAINLGGSEISSIKLGSTNITSVYKGEELIWPVEEHKLNIILPEGLSVVDGEGNVFPNGEGYDDNKGLTGIGVNSEGHSFIFAIADEPMSTKGADDQGISTPKSWSNTLYGMNVPDLLNITSKAIVLQNFASKANTDAIMAALATSNNPSETDNAAWVARNYSAGVIAKGQWDLPAMGILKLIFDKKSEIQTLVNAIGMSYWNDIIWNVYCWSSNEKSSYISWYLAMFDGSASNFNGYKSSNIRFVIPIYTIN